MKKEVIITAAIGQSTRSMLMINLMAFQAKSILVMAVHNMEKKATMVIMAQWHLVAAQVLLLATGID